MAKCNNNITVASLPTCDNVDENDYLIVYNNDSTCKVKFSDFVFGAENLDFYPDLEELILNVESLNSVVIPGSANWNSVYTTVQLNSAGWESLADGDVPTLLQQVRDNGSKWDDVVSTVSNTSGSWSDTTALVNQKYSTWDRVAIEFDSSKDNWDSAYNATRDGIQAIYEALAMIETQPWYEYLTINTGDGDGGGTGIGGVNYAAFHSLYTTVELNSASWEESFEISTLSARVDDLEETIMAGFPFLSLQGGTVNGRVDITNDLYVTGDIRATGDLYVNKNSIVFSDDQTWSSQDATQSKQVFNNYSELSAAFEATTNLVNENNATWEQASNSVLENEIRWKSAYERIQSSASSWDQAVSSVNANSDDWSWAYNTVTTSKVAWDQAADKINASEDEWDYAYRAVLSGSVNWNNTSNVVTDNADDWTDTHDIVVAKQSDWDQAYNIVVANSNNWDNITTRVTSDANKWDLAYSLVIANSAQWSEMTDISMLLASQSDWNYAYNKITNGSNSWDNAANIVSTNSTKWDHAYTILIANSADWSDQPDVTSLLTKQAFWDQTYTIVTANSSYWSDSIRQLQVDLDDLTEEVGDVTTIVRNYSAEWFSPPELTAIVSSGSANWNETYNWMLSDSPTNNTTYNQSTFVNVSGDAMTGSLSVDADVSVHDNLKIYEGKIIFGDGQVFHGVTHDPLATEELTKQDVKDFKSVYNVVHNNSGDWFSPPELTALIEDTHSVVSANSASWEESHEIEQFASYIRGVSGGWEDTHNWVEQTSATNNPVYNQATFVNVSGDTMTGDLNVDASVNIHDDINLVEGSIIFGDGQYFHGVTHDPAAIEELNKQHVRDFKDVQSVVSTNSGDWFSPPDLTALVNATHLTVNTNSANWSDAYNTLTTASAEWDVAYSYVTTESATNNTAYNRSTFVNVSGDTMTGPLCAEQNIHILDGDLVFGDDGVAHGHEHTPDEIEVLSKQDLRNLKGVYSTVFINSGNWFTPPEIITLLNSSSANWNYAYETIVAREEDWDATAQRVELSGDHWDHAHTIVLVNSANWNATYSRVYASGDNWDSTYHRVDQSGDNWDQTHADVEASKGRWTAAASWVESESATNNSDYNRTTFVNVTGDTITGDLDVVGRLHAASDLNITTGSLLFGDGDYDHDIYHAPENLESLSKQDVRNFKNVYSDVSDISANWNSTYSWIQADSATNNSIYNRTTFVNTSGDTITGDLDITGKITSNEAYFTSLTAVSSFVDVIDIKVRELSGYDIIDGDLSVDGDVSAQNNLYVTDGKITFGDNHLAHGFEHAPGEIEDLTKYDVRDFKSTYSTVYTNSADWVDSMSLVRSSSANWESTYNSVLTTSADWNSTRTSVNTTSANWNNVYTDVSQTSADWNSTRTSVNTTSANWNNVYTDVSQTSADWNSTRTSVNNTSANWNNTYSVVSQISADWNSTRNSVNSTSGKWDSVYNFVNADSATNNSDYNRTTYVNVTGDTITGDLDITGHVEIVERVGIDNDLNLTTGDILFGDGLWDHDIYHAPENLESLTKQDVKNFKNVYVDVSETSANWDSVYNWVQADSATNNSDYNRTTYVNVTGDTITGDLDITGKITSNEAYFTSLTAVSSFVDVIDIKVRELSGYDIIDGDLSVDGDVSAQNNLYITDGEVVFGDNHLAHGFEHAPEEIERLTKYDVRDFKSTYSSVYSTSANWNNVYTDVSVNSADWNSTRNSVYTTSADWNSTRNSVYSTSANWDNVYTDVSVNSADWDSTRNSVYTTSANWDNVYTDVSETSAEWDSVYNFVNADSATNNSDYNRSVYVNTSGDTITGDLDITGKLTGSEAYFTSITAVSSFFDVVDIKVRELSGYDIIDGDLSIGGKTTVDTDLFITHGEITFGDDGIAHGHEHTPEEIEHLTKYDVRDFKSTRLSVYTTSGNWDSTHASVLTTSANWDSVYNWVQADSATNNSDYNRTTFVNVTGDLMTGPLSSTDNLHLLEGEIVFGDDGFTHGHDHTPEDVERFTKRDLRDFKSTYSSVYNTSANWDSVHASVLATSGDWDSTHTSVYETSANWDSVHASVFATSTNWDNVYTDVSETSASWDSVYSFVNADSATNNSDYNRTTFVNVTGDTITGDLDITGRLTGNEAYFTSITAVSSFVDVIDIKVRELSGYDIIDGDLGVDGDVTAQNKLYITHGDITFGDSGLAHGHLHTPEEIEHLSKYDVRDFKSTRLSVYTTSGNWDSTHTSVLTTSAEWDSVYSWVQADSATNNSDYNRTTYVNVTGDSMTGPLSSTNNIHLLEGKLVFGDDGFTHGHDHTPEDLEDFTKRDLRDFKSTYSSVYNTSANWDSVHASVLATSGDWDSTHASVYNTSGNWDSVHASVFATSTNWDNVYTDVSETSAEWDSVYSWVQSDSATNNSDYNRTTYVNVTGDTITGDLDIQGHLTGTTAVFTSITALSSVVDVIDIKARELSGYDIIDGSLSVDGDVSAQNDLYITDGRITFGDNHMVHGFAHAPEEIEHLTKYDVRDFKSTRLSVYTTSGNWDSTHTSVLTTSASWDSVYSFVNADSATNNSDYNRTTYVNVTGDLMTGPLSSTDNLHLLEGEIVFGDDDYTHDVDHSPEDIERFTKRDLRDFKSTYSSVYNTSGNWDSVHASVLATSAEWDSVYSWVQADSATNNSDYNRTAYVNVTGDTITGSLSVVENFDVDGNTRLRGDLIVDGDVWFTAGNQGGKVTINLGDNDTDNIVFNADVDSNIAPDKDVTYTLGTTANQWKTLHVQDVESSNNITADNNLYVTHGELIFGDSGYDHGHHHTPDEIEPLNKYDVRNFKSTHLSVYNTSANWDNVYTDVSITSANWNSTHASVRSTSASWDSVYSFVNSDSGTNNSDYNRTTYVNITGDTITGHLNVSDRVELSNDLNLLSGEILFGDGDWEHDSYHAPQNLESLTKQDVKNFKNVYTDVSETSASWDSVYSFVNADSATNNSDYNRTTYVNVTGDTITGDLDITGKVTSNEAYFTSLTAVSSFVDVIDIKVRELSGYDIIDGDLSVDGDVSAQNNLYVTDGKITFGDNHLAHGFVHAPEEIEDLTKFDVRDFKSTYSTVYTNSARWGAVYDVVNVLSANWESTYNSVLTTSANWDNVYTDVSVNSANWNSTYTSVYNTSGNWDSVHASVLASSANWDSVYSWVKADSATNNSAYNEATYVNAAGDTMTGSLEVQQGIVTETIKTNDPTSALKLYGGTDNSDGARLELYGANNSNSQFDGRVHLQTNDLYIGDIYDPVDGSKPWMLRVDVDQENFIIGDTVAIDNSMLSVHGKTTIDGDARVTGNVKVGDITFNGTGSLENLTKQDVRNFKNVYTDVSQTSADWNSTRNSVNSTSANWNNTYTVVSETSADWNSTRNSVHGASANWDNVYTDVSQTSGEWDSVYSFVNADSATNNSNYNRTTFVNVTGDTITGDLDITGKITSNEAYFTSLTAVSSFVDVIDIKVRELSGYDIIDGDLSVGGDVSAQNNLYVTDGKITFGDNHLAHGFVHAPEEIEDLTKFDVRDFKSTYSTVYTNSALWTSSFDQVRALSANWESTYLTMLANSGNWYNTHLTVNELSASWHSTYTSVYNTSGNWDSVHASVLTNSANWDSVYSWVKADSATNNSAYNHATYVDVAGDVMTGALEVQQGIVTQMIRSNDPTQKLGLYGGSSVDDGARIEILGGNQGNSSNDNRIQLHADDIFVGDVYDPIDANNPWVFRINVDDQNIVVGGLTPIDNSVLTVHGYTTIDGDARVTGNVKVGDITFNGTGEIENLTKLDVRNFKSTYTSVYDTSANWDSVHASVLATSADWDSTRTSVFETSALWNSVYNSVYETSGDWDSTRTSVYETSGDWNSTRTSVYETSGDWNSTRTSVFETSANWDSVYSWVQADSATNNSDYNRTTYVNVTGDSITGDLDISNRVSAYEGYFTSLTAVSSFVDVIDIKVRELSGYDIIDGDLRVDGDTTVDRLLLGEDKDPLTEFNGGQTLNITNDDDSRISSKYKYTHAVNVFGTSNFLINGVEFQAETQGYGSNWSISDSTGNALHLETTSVSGYVGEMLADNHRYIVDAQTITLSGLATGRKYAFTMYNQAWSTDNVPKRALISSDSDTSIVAVDQNEFVSSTDGQIVEYVFVAHDDVVKISITPDPDSSWNLYAFSNREVWSYGTEDLTSLDVTNFKSTYTSVYDTSANWDSVYSFVNADSATNNSDYNRTTYVNVTGDTITGSLSVQQDLTIDGTTMLSGEMFIDGHATFNNGVTAENNVYIKGDLRVDGNVWLLAGIGDVINVGESADDVVVFQAPVDSGIVPFETGVHDLGSPDKAWKNVYADAIVLDDISLLPEDVRSIQGAGNIVSTNSGYWNDGYTHTTRLTGETEILTDRVDSLYHYTINNFDKSVVTYEPRLDQYIEDEMVPGSMMLGDVVIVAAENTAYLLSKNDGSSVEDWTPVRAKPNTLFYKTNLLDGSVIDSIDMTRYKSAKYTIEIEAADQIMFTEISMVTNGINGRLVEYCINHTTDEPFIEFEVNLNNQTSQCELIMREIPNIETLWNPGVLTAKSFTWLDAADSSKIELDSLNTFTKWRNSGKTDLYMWAHAGSEPEYVTAGDEQLNGRNVLKFTGNTDFIESAYEDNDSRGKWNEDPVVWYLVFKPTGVDNFHDYLLWFEQSTGQNLAIVPGDNDEFFGRVWMKTNELGNGPYPFTKSFSPTDLINQWNIFELEINPVTQKSTMYLNGHMIQEDVDMDYEFLASSEHKFKLHANWIGSQFTDGYLAEFLVLEDYQRIHTEGYLAWKWGLVDRLPETHAYKHRPPQAPCVFKGNRTNLF